MRTCTVLTITLSLALFARANEDEKRKLELYKGMSGCCKTTKVLGAIFQSGGIICGGKYLADKVSKIFKRYFDPDELASDLKDGCLVECIFDANGYLNQQKGLNEKDFKRKLMAKAEEKGEEVKTLFDTAITKCLAIVAKNPVIDRHMCKSNSQLLSACIARHVLFHCPASEWKENKDKCEGRRISFKNEVTALEKKSVKEDKVQT